MVLYFLMNENALYLHHSVLALGFLNDAVFLSGRFFRHVLYSLMSETVTLPLNPYDPAWLLISTYF